MGNSYKALDQKEKVIRFLVIIIITLSVLLIHAHTVVINTPKEITAHMPPDIRTGGAIPLGLANDVTAYDFAFTIFSSINTWVKDASKEAPAKINMYENYISGTYYRELERRIKRNKQALKGRTRTVEYVPNEYKVKALGGNRFQVELTVEVTDKINGNILKNDKMKYYFNVVPSNVLRSINPFQLKIDGEYLPSHRV